MYICQCKVIWAFRKFNTRRKRIKCGAVKQNPTGSVDFAYQNKVNGYTLVFGYSF